MMTPIDQIKQQLSQALQDLHKAFPLTEEALLVVGTSTSEVIGAHIGTNGSHEVAEVIYRELEQLHKDTGVQLAFQCCEHLNRALVLDEKVAKQRGYELVSAIPIRKAGGAMATYAFKKMKNPVLVEEIQADAGIDIGDTLIGMHLKKVAVPVRSRVKSIGEAHVTMAKTRPKLIGGIRAVYEKTDEHE
ncbi:TIGR01440 family protein [Alkalihalobacillus sp. MEB130]|uniref:TIGR01440 family protein n=1 Tax=Alkalihalobacillus sp. MEB130 TaxID=2976704 RepID=UPI0028DFFB68|nr:TIGR01440 family protein [Alkalihalobacillus sp. MEB130]MDT8860440.1 TIGR01440 family protein [Alkalihalobacillus sp. MEB130]